MATTTALVRNRARHWAFEADGRIRCDVCPRQCTLREGQRGLCFVRKRENDALVLTTYGRSSGFAIDPIEKKPLHHFFPGSRVLSFGTAGCNLTCSFCQNWNISKARSFERLQSEASPEDLARMAVAHETRSVAFTYNDPVIFLEYAVDTARACRNAGIETVAVTAGYIFGAARREFFAPMTAANIDLKGFTEDFYRRETGAHLAPVLDTIRYVKHETDLWLEVTTLLIPGLNDSDEDLKRQCDWMLTHLGKDVPLHFSAFHPAYKRTDCPRTPLSTLTRARSLALSAGLSFVYTGNARDPTGATTYCPNCQTALIVRDGYTIEQYRLAKDGTCPDCGARIPGRF
ncbi:MAG: AmmeMemoRadiSam system radical SAM enzyme [Deltaproteobacteria bacterium]|nr:AmmeMemoRadiSam system radical SAM enzyme [Deltaproteobacteria bacterium]